MCFHQCGNLCSKKKKYFVAFRLADGWLLHQHAKSRLGIHVVVYISSRSNGRSRRGLYAILILKSIFHTTKACCLQAERGRSESFEAEMLDRRKDSWFEGKCKLLSDVEDPRRVGLTFWRIRRKLLGIHIDYDMHTQPVKQNISYAAKRLNCELLHTTNV
jgi:hypothetical protein